MISKSEQFFTTADEEYDAASWLSTLKAMQRLGDRLEDYPSIATYLCRMVLQKPDEFLDIFRRYTSDTSSVQGGEKKFLMEMGATIRGDRISQGLSDAALLLCDDPIGEEIRETSSFARLVPLVDEMADFCDTKFLKNATHANLAEFGYATRLAHAKTEADFYIRLYDREPQEAAISPLYL
ncbi:MAG TPA: hypothetical protein VGE34_02025 [Candidatus Saccharimonadales bacterium]